MFAPVIIDHFGGEWSIVAARQDPRDRRRLLTTVVGPRGAEFELRFRLPSSFARTRRAVRYWSGFEIEPREIDMFLIDQLWLQHCGTESRIEWTPAMEMA